MAAAVAVVIVLAGAAVFLLARGGDDDHRARGGGGQTTTTVAGAEPGGATTAPAAGDVTTTEAPATTTGPSTEPSSEPSSDAASTTSTGFVEPDGSVVIPVEVADGLSATLVVTPDPGFDVTVTVDGGGFVDEWFDAGFSGEAEVVVLPSGTFTVTVAGYDGASGGYVAVLT